MSKDNPSKADIELADEFMQHALMEETKEYLQRGRQHVSLQLAELNDRWVTAFRDWFNHKEQEHGNQERVIAIDDLSAELRLRGLEPPYASVPDEVAAMHAEMVQLGPDSASDSLRSKIRDFRIQRSKRKN
jgi:hypothetical protein